MAMLRDAFQGCKSVIGELKERVQAKANKEAFDWQRNTAQEELTAECA
jgi:hypothetical protein